MSRFVVEKAPKEPTYPSDGKTPELSSRPADQQLGRGVRPGQHDWRPASAFETCGLIVKELRPKQWVKNLIAFAPLLFSRNFDNGGLFLSATACVAAFSLVSGGVYVLNDLADVEADRRHPIKCERPIASGRLSSSVALSIAILVIVLGLALSYAVRPTLLIVTLSYLALSLLYCFVLKHQVILDVFGIAGGFLLRAVAGAVAVHVSTSGWFLACTCLGALFLALEKRRQELTVLGDDSCNHRKSLGGYSLALLDRMEGIVVPSLLTAYAFYSFLSFHGQWMMLTLPFVLYGVMRYQFLSVRTTSTGQPEDVFWSDKPIQVTIVLWLLTCALVVYEVPQRLHVEALKLDSLGVAR